jgi:hypothetical protein
VCSVDGFRRFERTWCTACTSSWSPCIPPKRRFHVPDYAMSKRAKRSVALRFENLKPSLCRAFLLVVMFGGNRCSSVGIVSRLRVERPMHRGSVPAEGKRCFSFPNVCTGSGPDSVFRRVKRPGREATSLSHLVPYMKNEWAVLQSAICLIIWTGATSPTCIE